MLRWALEIAEGDGARALAPSIADGLIGVAFLAIAFGLISLVRRRPDIDHRRVPMMLAASLLAVGVVHVVGLFELLGPVAGLETIVKLAAAAVCVATAVALFAAPSSFLRRPSASALEETNRELQDRIRERERAEETVRQANALLEARVRARTRELERSNEELERFAYVASHDLREPLRMVKSYTQLLARRYRGKLDATADEYIAYAVEGCDRMGELIHDVLEYSRVGRKEQRAVVDVEEALAAARQNLQVAIDESGARISAEPLPRLHARRSDLVALLQNLLSNAITYRRPGVQPHIYVGAERRGDEDVLYVRDDGIGIDTARHAERIFGMFARLHARDEYAGTGMGLALCKKIMETHGGRIWVESAPGHGATFYCAFPRGSEPLERFPRPMPA